MKRDRRVHVIRHVTIRMSDFGSGNITVKANNVKIGFIHQGSDGLFRFGFGDPACESPEEALDWLVDEIAGRGVEGHTLHDVTLRLSETRRGWQGILFGDIEIGHVYRGKDGLWTQSVTYPSPQFGTHLEALQWLAAEIQGRPMP